MGFQVVRASRVKSHTRRSYRRRNPMLSKDAKIILGVGALAAVGAGIWYSTRPKPVVASSTTPSLPPAPSLALVGHTPLVNGQQYTAIVAASDATTASNALQSAGFTGTGGASPYQGVLANLFSAPVVWSQPTQTTFSAPALTNGAVWFSLTP